MSADTESTEPENTDSEHLGPEPAESERPERKRSDDADSSPQEAATENTAANALPGEVPENRPAEADDLSFVEAADIDVEPDADPVASVPGPNAAGESRVPMLPGGIKAAVEAILMVADQAVNELELAEALLVPVRSVEKALDEIARDYDGYGDLGTAESPAPGADLAGSAGNEPAAEETQPTPEPGDAASGPGYTEGSSDASTRARERAREHPVREPRGMELRQVAGGWKLYSRAEFAPWVARFVLEGQTSRLSQAALETLAVIAYRQPVSRAKVSSVRGVNVDGVVKTLKTRGMIEEAETPGESGAILYRTTPLFLEKIGLDSLDELPKISPYLPGAEDAGEYEQRLN